MSGCLAEAAMTSQSRPQSAARLHADGQQPVAVGKPGSLRGGVDLSVVQ